MAGFGIVEAAQRARAWSPHLKTAGQRLVLSALVVFTGSDSMADPTSRQLSTFTGYTERACRRILTELEATDVITPIGGRSTGRRSTQWSIKPGPMGPGSTRTGESGSVDSTRTLQALTRTEEATNPDTARSSSESSETTEGAVCALHAFEDRGPGGRFRVCGRCGLSASRVPA